MLDERQTWLEAHVIETRGDAGEALIHYRGFHAKFDEWLPPRSNRVRPFGRRKAVAKRRRQPQPVAAPKADRRRCIAASGDQFVHYLRALERHDLEVVAMEGDGNCLFRSVSHQVYGDARHFALVRRAWLHGRVAARRERGA